MHYNNSMLLTFVVKLFYRRNSNLEIAKLGKTLKLIDIHMHKQVNTRLKELDLSMTQGLALIWLEESDTKELPIKSLEKMFETSQPTTLGVINRLEEKSLVTTYITQKRTKNVKITEEGLYMVTSIKKYIKEGEDLFFKDFTSGEKTIFLELLHKAKRNILQEHDMNEHQHGGLYNEQ